MKTDKEKIISLEKQVKNLQKELKSTNSVKLKVLKELGLGVRDRVVNATIKFAIKNQENDIIEKAVRKTDLIEFLNKL